MELKKDEAERSQQSKRKKKSESEREIEREKGREKREVKNRIEIILGRVKYMKKKNKEARR